MPASEPTQQQQPREVASGVVNLGNTCYMNAVLQALAHAPELCLALDYENHRSTCPIARDNEERRRNSPTPSSDDNNNNNVVVRKRSLRKSKRGAAGKKSPTMEEDASVDQMDFCTLCELERHLAQVHQSRGEPVAPDTFVNGFVDRVAPPWFKLGVQEDSHEFLRLLIDAMQKSCRSPTTKGGATPVVSTDQDENDKNLYPFKLFRGTVESNVSCDSCHATSATIDPIEDIGLEVTTTHGSSALSDLSSAFCRFTKAEPLTGYKCDRCHKTGRATKQSRLASIPPILTLHLKRFRYGSDGKPLPPPARRGGREVSQLVGSSGSAKIEGHIKFLEIFDLKPFLTQTLASHVKSMFCRLFCVIVHAGKNSHSGHYVAYVRNLSKNEWWKMDDARVSRASSAEVLSAEAYMLFYRVVDHPVAQQLRAAKAKAVTQEEEKKKQQTEEEEKRKRQQEEQEQPTKAIVVAPPPPPPDGPTTRKRKRDAFPNGEEWARAKTRLPPSFTKLLRRAEEFISDNIEFTPDFFKVIMEEAAKKNGTAPTSGVCEEANVQGGVERFRPGLIELIYKLASQANVEGNFLLDDKKETAAPKDQKALIVPVVDANEPFL